MPKIQMLVQRFQQTDQMTAVLMVEPYCSVTTRLQMYLFTKTEIYENYLYFSENAICCTWLTGAAAATDANAGVVFSACF